jgi:integrase/recombinase XerD
MPANNAQLITEFLTYLQIECGAKENTIVSYKHDCSRFAGWLGKPISLALRADLQSYISASLESGISGRTVARRLSCLRHFFRFLIDEEEIKTNPARNLPVPKCWKTIPRSLPSGDVDKMVAHPGPKIDPKKSPSHTTLWRWRKSGIWGSRILPLHTWLQIRDRAMLLTFFASGLRESELAALRLEDLDLDAGAAKVWDGKGGKDGLVLLSPPAITALKLYLETAAPFAVRRTSHVFLNRFGGGPLSRVAIWKRVSTIAEAALGRRVSPHVLRHSFATALIEGGADIRDVQVLMRHASIDTTAVYIHTDLNQLRKTYVNHPRATRPPEAS